MTHRHLTIHGLTLGPFLRIGILLMGTFFFLRLLLECFVVSCVCVYVPPRRRTSK